MQKQQNSPWPVLDYRSMRPTVDHIHRLVQIAGKYTLNQLYEPNWTNIIMTITPRGFATPVLEHGGISFEIHYDLVDSLLTVTASTGTATLPLGVGSVADFYIKFLKAVEPLGIGPIGSLSQPEIEGAAPIDQDVEERPYDPEAAKLIAFAQRQAAAGLSRYQASFRGARSRTGLFWGGFDISATRYRGRLVPPSDKYPIFMQNGMLEEVVNVGFAFGDERSPQAGFYAYIAPSPDGLDSVDFGHPAANWYPDAGLVVMPWNSIRSDPDPVSTVVMFADSVYRAAIKLGGWPDDLTIERVPGWEAGRTLVAHSSSIN